MAWDVEFSDEFGEWWDGLDATEQKSVDFTVTLLAEAGPTLKMPHSSGVETSRHRHMRELRIQHEGHPYRSFMRSILAVQQFCWSAETKQETTDGTRNTFLGETIFTTST
jgi:hypothetical protein